jgi:anaerobic selenocysteine-containing dehydrogenase
MQGNLVDRRAVLKTISAAAVAGAVAARPQRAAAQQVKWSAGTEAPKLRAPADATDCHHHI